MDQQNNNTIKHNSIFPFAKEDESYFCRKCKYYWVVGNTDFDKKSLRFKICPGCRVKK